MITHTNNNETVKIDFPTSLVAKLENLFPTENGRTFKKILFTIYLINQGKYNTLAKKYENYYELSRTHYKTYVSLNAKLAPIMDTLITGNVIKKQGGYTNGSNYQKYQMVSRFSYSDKDTTTMFLTSDDGAYVSRYIQDGYIVKYNTSVKSVIKKKEINTPDVEQKGENSMIADHSKTIENMSNEIQILRQMMDNMAKEIEVIKNKVNNEDTVAPLPIVEQIEEVEIVEEDTVSPIELEVEEENTVEQIMINLAKAGITNNNVDEQPEERAEAPYDPTSDPWYDKPLIPDMDEVDSVDFKTIPKQGKAEILVNGKKVIHNNYLLPNDDFDPTKPYLSDNPKENTMTLEEVLRGLNF